MSNNHKGSAQVIAITLVVIAILIGLYFFTANRSNNTAVNSGQPMAGTTNTEPVITNDQGLMSASENLDSADVTQLNNGLDQNASDSATFAPRIRYKNGTSLNWAGYAAETNLTNPQSNAVSDVKGGWTVPALTCGSTNTYSSAWVGIDGYSDNSVEQLGTEHDCMNGHASYYVWYEMYPKPSFKINLPVKAGDVMNAEVRYLSGNKFQLSIVDTTTGKSFSTSQKSNALRQSAEWIMEAPWSGGVLPLANFGTIQFANAQVTLNGYTGSINNSLWKNDAITMVNSSGVPKAMPSSLGNNGTSFSVQRNSN